MRVLGIDPGLRRCGYGCVALGADGAPADAPVSRSGLRLVEAGLIRLDPKASVSTRLRVLAADLRAVMDTVRPTLLAVEQVFAHPRHVRTAILMAHARGVVLLAGAERQLPLVELAPATIKRSLTGSGRATKAQVQFGVMDACGLASPPEPDDVSDAIAIALCAARRDALEGDGHDGRRVDVGATATPGAPGRAADRTRGIGPITATLIDPGAEERPSS